MNDVLTQSRVIMPMGAYKPKIGVQAVGKKSVRVRARLVRKGVAIVGVAIILALLFVWTRVRVVQVGYQVSQLNRQVSELKRQKNQIEVEVAKLKSPDRLEKIAVEQFSMRLPAANEIVFIRGKGEAEKPNANLPDNSPAASETRQTASPHESAAAEVND